MQKLLILAAIAAVSTGQPVSAQTAPANPSFAVAPRGLFVDAAELPLADIAVIALEPLLGHELDAVIGRLLAPLAVLAGAVFALVDRALGAAPEIEAQAAVDLVLGFETLAHEKFLIIYSILSR